MEIAEEITSLMRSFTISPAPLALSNFRGYFEFIGTTDEESSSRPRFYSEFSCVKVIWHEYALINCTIEKKLAVHEQQQTKTVEKCCSRYIQRLLEDSRKTVEISRALENRTRRSRFG